MILSAFYILIIIVAIIEWILAANWNHFYFKSGLTTFKREIYIGEYISKLRIDLDYLNIELSKGWGSHIVFKALSKNECGFQRRFSIFRRDVFFLHGILSIDTSSKSIKIKGKLNWLVYPFFLMLSLILVYRLTLIPIFSPNDLIFIDSPIILPVLLIWFFVNYILQIRRLKKIVRTIQQTLNETEKV